MDKGFDGQPLLRGRGDDREVTQAFQRHGQRTGDRRSSERQHIHFGPQCFELFFLFDTEAVFFINDQKPQPRKLDVVLNQAMGTDNDICAAIGHFIERSLTFFGGTEAG